MSPVINYDKPTRKKNSELIYFGSHSLFLWAFSFYFTNILAHLSVIAPYVISVFIIWWSGTLSQQQNNRKRGEICPKLTIKKVESRFGVFTINFRHISQFFQCFYYWLWIGKCLWRSSFLCKYYYSKSKDEQMLYLTSFKIEFLNS